MEISYVKENKRSNVGVYNSSAKGRNTKVPGQCYALPLATLAHPTNSPPHPSATLRMLLPSMAVIWYITFDGWGAIAGC